MPEELQQQILNLVKRYGSYEALARELGVSWVTVQRWAGGRTKPSPLAARRIRELLGESTELGPPS